MRKRTNRKTPVCLINNISLINKSASGRKNMFLIRLEKHIIVKNSLSSLENTKLMTSKKVCEKNLLI